MESLAGSSARQLANCRHRLAAPDGRTHQPRQRATAPQAIPQPNASTAHSHQPNAAETPLVDAVRERGDRMHEVPFHVPGHKRGSSTPGPLQPLLGSALRFDLTELDGLDYLSSPTGRILQAQQAAAALWGAQQTWLLVNGTTAGILAAVLATCGPGDALLLARNCHLSAFNAMVLAGCTPVWVQPCYDSSGSYDVAHHITPAALEAGFREAEQRGLRPGAVLVVSPTYYGATSNIAALAAICHSRGVPLLVDEAHGAHLGLHPGLPPSALQQGADLVVQSTHKQLSAMTQAAMLHSGRGSECRVDQGRVSRALQIVQSSSPSYLLMASLDAARAQAADPGALEPCLAAAAWAREQLSQLPGVSLLSAADIAVAEEAAGQAHRGVLGKRSAAAAAGIDPLRLTVSVVGLGISGYQAAPALEQQHGVVPELATSACVVLACSIGTTQQHAEALVAAFRVLCQQNLSNSKRSTDPAVQAGQQQRQQQQHQRSVWLAAAPSMALTPRKAYFAQAEAVPLEQAAGRVAAELLCPYPPGVPALLPGERISTEVLALLQQVLASGGKVTGASDESLGTLRVIKEQQ